MKATQLVDTRVAYSADRRAAQMDFLLVAWSVAPMAASSVVLRVVKSAGWLVDRWAVAMAERTAAQRAAQTDVLLVSS